MKNSDFFEFICSLFDFIDKQVDFIKENVDGDRVYGSGGPTLRDPFYMFIFAEGIALGITGVAFWAVRELLRRAYARISRPKYYPQENVRRRRLAAERRKIRLRRTLNAAPTKEELRAQYAKVRRNPKEMIRFGSMLCDLEAYVDNGLVRDEYGTITGRRPGIKGWLAEHCPEMHAHYKTVIRYKALAEKFRQAVGLADPHPAAEALGDETPVNTKRTLVGKNETTVRNTDKSAFKALVDKARSEAETIFAEAGFAEAGLLVALGKRLDPNMIMEQPGLRRWFGRKPMTAVV